VLELTNIYFSLENMLLNYYVPSMEGSLTDQQILRTLITDELPDIDAKCKELDVPIAVITLPWFLCLFIHCVPLDVNLRILDLFFAFGRRALFLIALAIFSICKRDILEASDSMEIIFSVRDIAQTINADELIITSFQFHSVDTNRIDKLWAEHYPQVLKEIKSSHTNSNQQLNTIDTAEEQKQETQNPQVTFRRFPVSSTFKLQESNAELRKTVLQARGAPEVSHTTASLIYLIREGFTGQVISHDPSDPELPDLPELPELN